MQDMASLAKPEFETATRLDPQDAEAYNALGFSEDALGNESAAIEDYQKALRICEQKGMNFDPPWINLSAYYNRHDEPDLAIKYAQKAIEINPKSDLAFYQLAKAYRFRGQWDQAAEALRSAIAVKPSSAPYYYVLSEIYRKLGKPKESEVAIDTFRKLEHDSELLESQIREARRLSVVGVDAPKDLVPGSSERKN